MPMFLGVMKHERQVGNTVQHLGMSDQRWRSSTGSTWEITFISARIHDSADILTAIPMCLGLGNTERLMGILSNI